MKRRDFLGIGLTALAAAGAGELLEELIWTPKKTIFVPTVTRFISVNVDATRAAGLWHNGLRHPTLDFLTTLPESVLFTKYPDLVGPWEEHRQLIERVIIPATDPARERLLLRGVFRFGPGGEL